MVFLTYKRYSALEIQSVSFNGNYGFEEGAWSVVANLGNEEVCIGS